MRRDCFFFVMETSRNDLETDSALPHNVLLSPYPNSQYAPGCRLVYAPMGVGGVNED
jgi:hypothetical protein